MWYTAAQPVQDLGIGSEQAMPLGIVSDEEFNNELNSNLPKANNSLVPIVRAPDLGRGHKSEVPEELRNVIAEEGIKDAPNDELAKLFGVSNSSVSAYKNGATSTSSYHKPDPKLNAHRKSVKEVLRNKAGNRLKTALNSITEEEISSASVIEKAMIAKHMSHIFKDMETEEKSVDTGVKFVIVVPQLKSESDYDIIDVK